MNSIGAILLDKLPGMSSHRALSPLKRIMPKVKIGHTGTLDRFAEGLLVVLLGSCTRLMSHLNQFRKRYRAVLYFGEETDTLDHTGDIVRTAAVPSAAAIEAACRTFIGEIEQIPPVYSALHVDGERASRRVRRGETVTLQPRRITIYDLEIVDCDLPTVTIEIECSSGTYIRACARDIAAACGSAAHLKRLQRLSIGPFQSTDSIRYSEQMSREDLDSKGVFTPFELMAQLPHFDSCIVPDPIARAIRNGTPMAQILTMMERSQRYRPSAGTRGIAFFTNESHPVLEGAAHLIPHQSIPHQPLEWQWIFVVPQTAMIVRV